MSDPIEEAVRRLRGLKDRIDRLEGQREGEGEINILRLIQDRTNTDDTVVAKLNDIGIFDRSTTGDTVTAILNDAEIFDRSTTGDNINARENDRDVTDRSTTGDTVATTTGNAADFVWADHDAGTGDKWSFFEFNNH